MANRLSLVLALTLLLAPLARAEVPAPNIPKAKGAHCVRSTQWMRRNHMKLLMHERDEVVHEGIRNKQETLPGCMSCHVSRLADGHYPSVTSPQFFCNSCHSYVGVQISCFSCHTNRPEAASASAVIEGGPAAVDGDLLSQMVRARPGQGGKK